MDHVVDVLLICQCIVTIERETITMDEFEEDTPQMTILHVILAETRYTLQYQRHRRNIGVIYTQ